MIVMCRLTSEWNVIWESTFRDPILHFKSSVSNRFVRTSRPPASIIATWIASFWRSKSTRLQRAMIVAVWFPIFRYLISFCTFICDNNEIVQSHFINKILFMLCNVYQSSNIEHPNYLPKFWGHFCCSQVCFVVNISFIFRVWIGRIRFLKIHQHFD